ncbi:hypothetical protein HC928_14065 [bacterium]|nr:hypothetical protein [bacterium]
MESVLRKGDRADYPPPHFGSFRGWGAIVLADGTGAIAAALTATDREVAFDI